MKCSNCGFEQPEGMAVCQKCQVIFAKLEERQAKEQSGYFVSYVQKQSDSTWVFWTLFGLLMVAGIAWFHFSGRGLPVPQGSYRDSSSQFALFPPPGWITVTPSNVGQLAAEYGDRFPPTMRQAFTQGNVVMGLVRMMEGGGPAAMANVVVVNSEMPRLSEKEKDEAVKEFSQVFSARFENYKMESAKIVKVDKLRSLKILSTGALRVETSPGSYVGYSWIPASYQSVNLKFLQVLVPGNGRTYIVTCMSEFGSFPIHIPNFNQILKSFRVVERPSLFQFSASGGALSSSLLRGVITFFIFLVIGLVRAFFR